MKKRPLGTSRATNQKAVTDVHEKHPISSLIISYQYRKIVLGRPAIKCQRSGLALLSQSHCITLAVFIQEKFLKMDFSVHRMRFSDWQPSAIKTLASDPFSCNLAVGREDGDIEIRDSSHQWYVQATAPGQKGFNLQALTWAADKSESGRLFGISLRGFVFEVDLLQF